MALAWLARRMQQQHGLEVKVECPADLEPPGDEWRVFLYTAIGECLFNIKKHADVNEATVTVQRRDEHLQVVVADAGAGFNVEEVKKRAGDSFGLLSIRERTALLGVYRSFVEKG